ncbi:DUF726-domain-containing protein [Aulographum hederae CBS 113979]|uniref:DUF726-domain-containing protein n=1 Tax=Aulographum hederae CBS 113979 TaxID=1176131 RepID=A0A6G1H6Y4_9PEZI|nr:DUF726-domain-containing protein [Aulographum hederae CBS 113979]
MSPAKRAPPKLGGKPKQKEKDGEDLTTLLDESQRTDLVELIALITGKMRETLHSNFDATAGLNQDLLRDKSKMSDEEKMRTAPTNPEEVARLEKEQKRKGQAERSLTSPTMRDLQESSFKAFEEWRSQILQRIGDAVEQGNFAKEKTAAPEDFENTFPEVGIRITEPPKFRDLFVPVKTPLTKLSMDKRRLILHSVLLLLLSLEKYSAASRILMLYLTSSLKLPLTTFEKDEYTTGKGLLEAAKEMTAQEETQKQAAENKQTRYWQVGIASVAGAALIGVTGGFAAPLLAAGVGQVMGGLGLGASAAASYLGSVAGSSLLIGGIFGAYGGRMTGRMMDEYAREVRDFEFIPIHSKNKTSQNDKEAAKQASDHDHKLRVTICASGWLTEKEEVAKPWAVISNEAEVFALKYELESLLNLGHAMDGMSKSAAWGLAQKESPNADLFADAAKWPIGLTKISRVLDSPYTVARARSDKAGEVLADALSNNVQGHRPVTLVGYSLGARLIYSCLKSLAERKTFGVVENVVMMGAPAPADAATWRKLRSVVSGRLINVHSGNDALLKFMTRRSKIAIAGLQAVEEVPGVENMDVGEEINSQLRYRFQVGNILKKSGFRDIDFTALEQEEIDLQEMEEEEKKQSQVSQRKQLQRIKSTDGKKDEAAHAELEATQLQKQVEAKTKKSLMVRVIEWLTMPNIPSVGDAGKLATGAGANVEKIGKDPTAAGKVAGEQVKDVQSSTESYAMWLARVLPSMPGSSRNPASLGQPGVGDATNATSSLPNAPKVPGGLDQGGYAKAAASYWNNLQVPKNLPNMPSFGGKGAPTDAKLPKSPGDVADVAYVAKDQTKALTDATANAKGKAGSDVSADAKKAAQGYAAQASAYLAGIRNKSKAPDAANIQPSTPDPAGVAGDAASTIKPPETPAEQGKGVDAAKNVPGVSGINKYDEAKRIMMMT